MGQRRRRHTPEQVIRKYRLAALPRPRPASLPASGAGASPGNQAGWSARRCPSATRIPTTWAYWRPSLPMFPFTAVRRQHGYRGPPRRSCPTTRRHVSGCQCTTKSQLTVGQFIVTPLLVDHSASDAYALLVEAGARRLLYSGDLRAHGRKPSTWRRLLDEPPAGVHALVLEGTRLSRPVEHNTTEHEVEQVVARLCVETEGIVLVFYSGQNIDRLVTVYRASKRAGRMLVLDLYAAAAAATGRNTIPQSLFGKTSGCSCRTRSDAASSRTRGSTRSTRSARTGSSPEDVPLAVDFR